MKKIILMICLMSSVFAGDIQWKSYKDAIKGDKPIFAMYSKEGCGYCKMALRDMKSDPIFSKYINTNFTPVYMDADSYDVPSYIDAPVTPAFYVLKKGGGLNNNFKDGLFGYGGLSSILQYVSKGLYIVGNK